MEIFPDRLWEYLNAATGAEYSMEELLKSGERIFNAERIFLVKAGFRKQDDSLPGCLTKESLTQGPTRGKVVHLDEMLAEYYKERGWDEEGVPTLTKLRELGLD